MVGVFFGLSSHHLPSLSRLATTCHTRTHKRQWSKDDKVFPFASPTTMCAAPAGQATSAIRAKARLIEAAGFCWLYRPGLVLCLLTRSQQRTVNIEIKAILCLIGQKRLHIPDGLHPALAHCGQGSRFVPRIWHHLRTYRTEMGGRSDFPPWCHCKLE